MKCFDLIIIGASASGLAATVNAAALYPNIKIAVFERLPRAGKKILATGNGRCNLSNLNAADHPYRNSAFAAAALKEYGVRRTLGFFESLGLRTFADAEGRVYPLSNTAASVLDSLRFALDPKRITLFTEHEVSLIEKKNNAFVVDGEFACKKLIIASGGKASPSQGSNGSGYALAKQLGHSVTPLVPSLVPLNADASVTKPLKGVRIHRAGLSLEANGERIASTEGELLFTDTGISGIAAMELASALEREKLKNVNAKHFTVIDFLPDMELAELERYLEKLCASSTLRDCDSLLGGLLPKAAGMMICKAAKLYEPGKGLKEFNRSQLKAIAKTAKAFPLKTTGAKGFDSAQVTSGGIKTEEINASTMESLICRGLFFAGEIIDVDGGCGGFNLQWAWSSGLLAGEMGKLK